MCTVTYINSNSFRCLTSSRDEHRLRPAAVWPSSDFYSKKRLFYPKDPVGNGSWFVTSDSGTVSVLLNGAFKKHEINPSYQKSRGAILVELMKQEYMVDAFNGISLQNIEPFTVISYDRKILYQFLWDGNEKFIKELDPSRNYIWASVTLYKEEIIQKRKNMFADFLVSNPFPDAPEICKFHLQNDGDTENGLMITRQSGILTQSITQAIICNSEIKLKYQDLLAKTVAEESVKIVHLKQKIL
jgi:hypothetical protein